MKRVSKTRKQQTGAVAIMVGLSILVLIMFLGIVVDLGRLYVTKTELSNAADACSLAAASQLDGASDSLDRAVSAGETVGTRNKVGFQGTAVTILDSDITFSDHLNGTYLDKTSATPANMKYAKCTIPQSGIIPYFMQVAGFGPQTVVSHAVATLAPGITNCGLPIAMCKNKTTTTCPDGSTPDAMGLCKSEWYCSKFTTGGSTANPSACPGYGSTGNFDLIDFTPPSGGASELANIITGTGQCNLQINNPVGETGVENSLSKAWDTRFGLYKGSDDYTTAPPDQTGYAYTPTSWPSQSGALANFYTQRTSNAIYQGNAATGLSLNGYHSVTSADLHNYGADRRIVVVPVVDCDCWGSSPPASCNTPSPPPSQQTYILNFACILMLHPWDAPGDPLYLEYEGLSNEVGSPCASTGLPGGPGSVGPMVPSLVR